MGQPQRVSVHAVGVEQLRSIARDHGIDITDIPPGEDTAAAIAMRLLDQLPPGGDEVTAPDAPSSAPQRRPRTRLALCYAVAICALCDRRLSPGAVRAFGVLTWRYTPGRVWRGPVAQCAREAGMSERASWRVAAELVELGYIRQVRGRGTKGLVIPAIEAALPPDQRASPDEDKQIPLAILGAAPAPVKKYLSS